MYAQGSVLYKAKANGRSRSDIPPAQSLRMDTPDIDRLLLAYSVLPRKIYNFNIVSSENTLNLINYV
jgi:hypothetical protein